MRTGEICLLSQLLSLSCSRRFRVEYRSILQVAAEPNERLMPQGYLKVGTTTSGKSIYISFVKTTTTQLQEVFFDFTNDEYFESYAVFQYLLMREYRRMGEEFGQTTMYKSFSRQIKGILVNIGKWDEVRSKNKVKTSIDVRNIGERLASPECKD